VRLTFVASAAAVAFWLLPRSAGAQACDSNLMIVLDRSCSMQQRISPDDPRRKWDVAEEALGRLTTDYEGQLRFGLIMFPDKVPGQCAQDAVDVPVGPDNEAVVRDAIAATNPNGPCVTPIDRGVGAVATDPAFPAMRDDSGRRSFAVLISDGVQSGLCGGNGADAMTLAHIEALYAAGYPTYVVGFGGGTVDRADLEAFAAAGGVPRDGMPAYYQADEGDELTMVLDAIAGSIAGSDPEFGDCAGAPCPDGRCFGDGETCTEGVCEGTPHSGGDADAGVGGGGDAGGDGDGGGGSAGGGDAGVGAGTEASGCACRAVAPRRGTGAWGLVALAGGLALSWRRRRRAA
jgi:hypothetical protein